MSEPSNPPPLPENGTKNQSPDDLERLTPRPQFHPGEPIPNRELWILERRLGGGGFGEVWLARHEWEEKHVAVKFCTHPASRKQLVTHEKKVVSRVMRYSGHHPNIVPLLDCNLSGDTPWLIYEYVSGGTLAQAVEKWKALPLSQRLEMTIRIMHALAGALARFLLRPRRRVKQTSVLRRRQTFNAGKSTTTVAVGCRITRMHARGTKKPR